MSILDERGMEDLLRENVRLTRDNNRLLRKLWRAQVMNFWSRIVFFAVLIGVPVYIYRVYLDDYVIQVQDAYRQLRENVSGMVIPVENASSAVLRSVSE